MISTTPPAVLLLPRSPGAQKQSRAPRRNSRQAEGWRTRARQNIARGGKEGGSLEANSASRSFFLGCFPFCLAIRQREELLKKLRASLCVTRFRGEKTERERARGAPWGSFKRLCFRPSFFLLLSLRFPTFSRSLLVAGQRSSLSSLLFLDSRALPSRLFLRPCRRSSLQGSRR